MSDLSRMTNGELIIRASIRSERWRMVRRALYALCMIAIAVSLVKLAWL